MTKDERVQFGDRVFAIRDRLAMTRVEFAARFGLTVASVAAWEEGRYKPLAVARLLVRAMELDEGLIARAAEVEAKLGPLVAAGA